MAIVFAGSRILFRFNIFITFCVQIFCYFINLLGHVNTILNRLIQNELNLRVFRIFRVLASSRRINPSALLSPLIVSSCAFTSPRTLIYALHVLRSGATSTATTDVHGATRGSFKPRRIISLSSRCTSVFTLVFLILLFSQFLFLLREGFSHDFPYLGTSTILKASTRSPSLISLKFANTKPHS